MDADVEASSEIDEILQQIAELDKWREIFNSRGLDLPQSYVKTLFSQVAVCHFSHDMQSSNQVRVCMCLRGSNPLNKLSITDWRRGVCVCYHIN
ncbi:hypothetical protein QQF64_007930 [Cirrhinus molitorella]|uniref:Uncharacterized protein n=1 Tax=Cirrhinus molitorella TaxID=172907 RepID=A0ABR3M8Q2_9TELE